MSSWWIMQCWDLFIALQKGMHSLPSLVACYRSHNKNNNKYHHIATLQHRLCACIISTANWILFINHRNRKVVGGTHNVLIHYVDEYSPNLSGVVLCNPFIWDILLFISGRKSGCLCACINSKTNFKTYPYLPVDVCCIGTPTNHLHTTCVKIN